MNRVLKGLMAISFLLAYDAHGEGRPGQPTPIAPQGETSLEAGTAQSKVRVRITTYEAGANEPAGRRMRLAMGTSRVSGVQEIAIQVGSKSLFVPLSVFSDLTDLREGRLRADPKAWILTLAGGDASESYVVTIEFDGERVRRRTLASSLAPKSLLEDTTYYTVVLKDE